jgi:hypothetical protein
MVEFVVDLAAVFHIPGLRDEDDDEKSSSSKKSLPPITLGEASPAPLDHPP